MDRDVEAANRELDAIKRSNRIDRNVKAKEKLAREMQWAREAGLKKIESPFYTKAQVLELLPFSRSTLHNMVKSGEFPAPKQIGARRIAWAKQDVDTWIDGKLNS